MRQLLILDDDARHRRDLATRLFPHYQVRSAAVSVLGATLTDLLRPTCQRPDVVIIDPYNDYTDALQLLRTIVAASGRPVIITGPPRPEPEIVAALRCGADTFLRKPFSVNALEARLAATLRRAPAPPAPAPRLVGDLRVDLASHTVTLRGVPIRLTRAEFDLLACLSEYPGRLLPRATVMARTRCLDDRATIDVLLSRLRSKLGESARSPRLLHTVRGRGIALGEPARATSH